jgi:hypothetical protein
MDADLNFEAILKSLPVIEKLPDDPEWEKIEEIFARSAVANLPEPED